MLGDEAPHAVGVWAEVQPGQMEIKPRGAVDTGAEGPAVHRRTQGKTDGRLPFS